MPRIRKEAKQAFEQLEQLEAEVARRRQEAGEAAQEEKRAREEVETLAGQRIGLADRDPELILHTGAPNPGVEKNPLVAIDEALGKFDLEDLAAKTHHTRKLLRAAELKVEDLIAAKYPLIEEALMPEVEQATQEASERIASAAQSVERLIGWNHRFTHLAANAPGLDPRSVRGIEHLGALRKSLEQAVLPSPIPIKPEGWSTS